MGKNYYDILGVDRNASESEIRKAFLKKSKECHPDTQVGKSDEEKKKAEEQFKEINEAYQILSDKEKKQYYDLYGTTDSNMGGADMGGMSAEDIFNMMREGMGGGFFGGFRRENRPKVGSKVVVNVHVTLKDIYEGIDKTFKYTRKVPCSDCRGTGSADGQTHKCPHCNGTGRIVQTSRTPFGIQSMESTCYHCNGTGKDSSVKPCKKCGGSGYETVENEITVNVNLDWLTNDRLQFDGYGNIPLGGGMPGPLIIVPVIDDYKGFRIDNNLNVVKVVEIPVIDCILGGNIKVECLDGKEITVKLKEGVADGETYEIPSKGFKHSRGVTKMIVVIKHKMPTKISKEDRKILEKLKETVIF